MRAHHIAYTYMYESLVSEAAGIWTSTVMQKSYVISRL